MLDCESENDEYPSEMDIDGVSAPELMEVHRDVLERERFT